MVSMIVWNRVLTLHGVLMNKFELWILKRIFRKLVTQGYTHDGNIRRVYSLLREAAQEEFVEDSEAGLDHYLHEKFLDVHNNISLTTPSNEGKMFSIN